MAGVFVVSLVSSPGSGKTLFLEKTLTLLRQNYRVAALVGDLATENDAMRLARSQTPVKQITTGTLCHLEAAMVQHALEGWDLHQLDFLFIENVGNLVCPSSYDLGENLRLVLISVTEGEDKPLKYPTIFNSADVAIVTKMDLAPAVEFDWDSAYGNIQAVRPGMRVLKLSAKTGDGMDEYLDFLTTRLDELRAAAAS
ncbi:MAG TPA: hydrogenase nickel incorporation protein HypB [Terriglobales bacterium]|nr:hydrogenase nickel incorporation protein HypB [Terriglobales bacterium]